MPEQPENEQTSPPWWQEVEDGIAAADDYTTTAEAVRDAAVLAFNHAARQCHITGMQGSWAALAAYVQVMSIDGPVMVLRAEDLLYPQCADLETRVTGWTSTREMRTWLAEEAAKKIQASGDYAAPQVLEHWQRLVAAALDEGETVADVD